MIDMDDGPERRVILSDLGYGKLGASFPKRSSCARRCCIKICHLIKYNSTAFWATIAFWLRIALDGGRCYSESDIINFGDQNHCWS
jgi:hypothetical protein